MKAFIAALTLLALDPSGSILMAAEGGGQVVFWGYNICAPPSLPSAGLVTISGQVLTNAVAIAAGHGHGLALRNDGTVVGWGYNRDGQATGTESAKPYHTNGVVLISGEVLSNVVAIAAGGNESLALRSDGKVIGWGGIAVPAGLNSVVSIARGWNHAAAVMRDGTAVVFGSGNIKRMDGVTNIVSVAIGGGDYSSSLLLKSDGTVSIWGGPGGGHEEPAPVRLNNVTSIAAGGVNLALEKDEHVVEWGPATPVPASLSNIVAISAGLRHNLALKNDGTVLTWGFNPRHALDVPAQLSNVVAIAAGWDFSLAITTNQANLHY